ncbi:MAG: hypothetical protein GC136_06110 [Alphaproteobacteria bacterium]|nr:hypothetical protein [Alphaproteobacteria bacterium]
MVLTNKAEIIGKIQEQMLDRAKHPRRGTDTRALIHQMAGLIVEISLFFDEAYEVVDSTLTKLSRMLHTTPWESDLPIWAHVDPHVLDFNVEVGRQLIRSHAMTWGSCEYEFHEMVMYLIQNTLISLEEDGIPRRESFRLLADCTYKGAMLEAAAHELCDAIIEQKISTSLWSLADSFTSLAAMAGLYQGRYMLGEEDVAQTITRSRITNLGVENLMAVMTQEAHRFGVPVAGDWRTGLAANDCPVSPPFHLMFDVESLVTNFFTSAKIEAENEQAVALAKAAGRLLAVMAGGDEPEVTPLIAKPLAVGAMTESFLATLQHGRENLREMQEHLD